MNDRDRLAPISAAERIEAMDVLRGFALLGILLMNIEGFVGPLFQSITGLDPSLRGADRWTDALVYIFVQGKFYTLFSLLFGMGFAVMLARAQAAGRPFVGLYLRRTLALFAIGLVHALLIWSGDVLIAYALIALVLLALFRRTPQQRLPKSGLGLYLVPSLFMLISGLAALDPDSAAVMQAAMAQEGKAMAAALEAQRIAYGSGDFVVATARRIQDMQMMVTGYLPVWGPQILGMFLIGAWFARSGAIARPQQFGRLYGSLRWVALPLGLALMLWSFWLLPTADFSRMDLTIAGANALNAAGSLLMCLGYVGLVIGGLQSPIWSRNLALLAPAGRMALSNYLLQSLVCTLLFYHYGLGLYEQLPRFWQVPFVLTLFALQVAFSHWWLRRYRFGPAEWLWRTLTYL
ncbi:MAG: DUF418 domain-containing protein, partial [Gammaproteobacteria bacterium]|nr:DUF418 domain-containing protein [Gammaproteobacteria bacterium]